jgi:hypothetical protein
MDYDELKVTMDHTDDITADLALQMLVADLRARGTSFEEPSDPMNDSNFIGLLAKTYDHGLPDIVPHDVDA